MRGRGGGGEARPMEVDVRSKAGEMLLRPIEVALPSVRVGEAVERAVAAGIVLIAGEGAGAAGPVGEMLARHPDVLLEAGSVIGAGNEARRRARPIDLACGRGLPDEPRGTGEDVRLIHVIGDGRDAVCREMARLIGGAGIEGLPPAAASHIRMAAEFHMEGRGRAVPVFSAALIRWLVGRWARGIELGRGACDQLGEHAMAVRSEELSTSAARVGEVLGFLGLRRDAALVRTMMGASRAQARGDVPGVGKVGATVGSWRRLFTQDDKALFKQTAGTLLIELGYERDLRW